MKRNVLKRFFPRPLTALFVLFIIALIWVGDEPGRQATRLQWSVPVGYSGSIEAISFSRNGTRLSLVGRDGALGAWELARDHGEPLAPAAQEYTYWPSFAADGKVLAVATKDDRVIVEDPLSKKNLLVLPRSPSSLSSLALSDDGKTLATGDDAGEIALWDVQSGRRRFHAGGAASRITCSIFSPDGGGLATGQSDGTLTLWSTANGSIKALMRTNRNRYKNSVFLVSVSDIAFSPDGTVLASVQYDNRDVMIWDAATGRQRATLHGASHFIKSVAFSPDGGLIACGEIDGTVILWDAGSYQEKSILHGHSAQVSSLSFSPDGRELASGDTDSVVTVWNVGGS